nr:ferritin family protein [uncultured Holophaga sp.]
MSFDFNADDVLEMAEQIERNGLAFYKEAALGIQDPESRDFLLRLADMEQDHEQTFADMRKALAEQEKAPTVFDPMDEAALYLQAMADTKVFFQPTVDFSSMNSILKTAIQNEKDSVAFYLGMKEIVPDALGKAKLDDIIKEEMSHIRLLSQELLARQ